MTKTQSSPSFPSFPDTATILEAQRRAALGTIDGLLAMQGEMKTAFEQGLSRMKKEAEQAALLGDELAREGMSTAFALSARALTAWRDEVARAQKAPDA